MAGGLESRPQRRIFVPLGQDVEVVLQGGTILRIHHQQLSLIVEQRSSTKEAQQEELKTRFPDVLGPHINARLTQHGYRVLGGEETSGEMSLMETTVALEDWMRVAKSIGISQREVLDMSADLFHNVTIAERRMGTSNAFVRGLRAEVVDMSQRVWEVQQPRRRNLPSRQRS